MGIIYKLGKNSIKFRVFYTYCEFTILWITLPFRATICLILETIAGILLALVSTKEYIKTNAIPLYALNDCLKRRKNSNG